jgi:hypothetical protein
MRNFQCPVTTRLCSPNIQHQHTAFKITMNISLYPRAGAAAVRTAIEMIAMVLKSCMVTNRMILVGWVETNLVGNRRSTGLQLDWRIKTGFACAFKDP